MKRQKLSFLFIILYCVSLLTPKTAFAEVTKEDVWPEGPNVFAESAIVMEASTGLILYEKNINEQYYPASITKILSSLIAIENSSLGEVVTFSKEAIFDVDLQSSRIGIDVGEQLTMQQSLYAILLESANEVTYGVAEHIAGSIPEFAKMMNERAKSIGCTNSNFVNPHGLPDPEHVTTAHDMALITREAMKNETFRKITATRTYMIPPTNIQSESRPLANHHDFILKSGYQYEGTIGGKTGYTSKSKYTLVTVAKRGNLELICVVLKDDSNEHQYTDTQKLLDYGFDNFSIYPIADLENKNIVEESPFFTRYNSILNKSDTTIRTDEKGYLVLPNTASFKDAKKEVSFHKKPVSQKNGNVIGTISYTYNGKYVGGADILYNKTKDPSLYHKAFDPKNTSKNVVSKSSGYLRPLIVGIISGIFLLIIVIYFIFVERPRLNRRKAYYKKRARRKLYQNDDYLDL